MPSSPQHPPAASSTSTREVIAATREWLEKAVIGLNLCPFAKAVYIKHQVRFTVTEAASTHQLIKVLVDELKLLSVTPADTIDTTLLIHPQVLGDFLDYNDFLFAAAETLTAMGLEGEIQIASFHPQYQFADAAPDAIENYTNRSPYPILHLLRETSIDKAVAAFPDASEIFERNIATMEALGAEGWRELFS